MSLFETLPFYRRCLLFDGNKIEVIVSPVHVTSPKAVSFLRRVKSWRGLLFSGHRFAFQIGKFSEVLRIVLFLRGGSITAAQ